jgi:hypothetical protein
MPQVDEVIDFVRQGQALTVEGEKAWSAWFG